jgi:hypothetical protein
MTTSTPFALRLSLAQGHFDRGEFLEAATALADLVEELDGARDDIQGEGQAPHGTADLRLLVARAYFHCAQLGRAEAVLRRVIEEAPTDAYAHLLLGRTLQRAGRHDEAARPLALAEVLGGYERPVAHGSSAPEPL